MQDEHVAVWVMKETHQAHARIDGIAKELHSSGDELLTRDVHVGHTERDSRGVG